MINFPLSPTVDQIFEFENSSWTFNGVGWVARLNVGPTGDQGAQGIIGILPDMADYYTKAEIDALIGAISIALDGIIG